MAELLMPDLALPTCDIRTQQVGGKAERLLALMYLGYI
jgi:hypothetical protein